MAQDFSFSKDELDKVELDKVECALKNDSFSWHANFWTSLPLLNRKTPIDPKDLGIGSKKCDVCVSLR